MIISEKYGFVIANPPKTGTTSLHAVVDKWLGMGGSKRVLCHLRGEKRTRHRLAPPKDMQDAKRYMMSRDPRTRLTSVYEFLRLRTTDQRWIAPQIQAIEDRQGREAAWLWLLKCIVEIRSSEGYGEGGRRGVHGSQPFMWCDTQMEMLEYMGGFDIDGTRLPYPQIDADPLLMETFHEGWVQMMTEFQVDEDELWDVQLPRRNAVPDRERLFGDAAAYWEVPGASRLLEQIMGGPDGLADELEVFGVGLGPG